MPCPLFLSHIMSRKQLQAQYFIRSGFWFNTTTLFLKVRKVDKNQSFKRWGAEWKSFETTHTLIEGFLQWRNNERTRNVWTRMKRDSDYMISVGRKMDQQLLSFEKFSFRRGNRWPNWLKSFWLFSKYILEKNHRVSFGFVTCL